jgi:hypothetical protein
MTITPEGWTVKNGRYYPPGVTPIFDDEISNLRVSTVFVADGDGWDSYYETLSSLDDGPTKRLTRVGAALAHKQALEAINLYLSLPPLVEEKK